MTRTTYESWGETTQLKEHFFENARLHRISGVEGARDDVVLAEHLLDMNARSQALVDGKRVGLRLDVERSMGDEFVFVVDEVQYSEEAALSVSRRVLGS